ncbi:MAG: hypothetical protein KKA90_05120 [Nanoarchaeota archaeon]|nr:hypothetical protein [Nanoarchaeota archaeon]
MNVGPVFGIIFALIALGLLLVFGFDQVMTIFSFNDEATILRQVESLEKSVADVYNLAEGSSKEFIVVIPKNTKFCFLNVSEPTKPSVIDGWLPGTITRYHLETPTDPLYGSNVWTDVNDVENGYKIGHLVSKINFCFTGKATAYLTNIGPAVLVERA